ncbi:hypothetical protein HDU83_005511 [Entophlyctis luteolus]|nr:hypothetical protein HDU82_004562 [Entophlyctis luteolus]KAJ3206335.1 hypothetical protein HDU82_004569 [Entophlyctis luteolus]KAJ3354356.1 hypothetical protein HDU83_005511 [Entophlyctis luteolus]KAJ3379170.1 hypothetical protein HDU84_006984 [Entophlyctis sp. JEL0112]
MSSPTASACPQSYFCISIAPSTVNAGNTTVTINSTDTAGWTGVSFNATSMATVTGYFYIGWADSTGAAQISARKYSTNHAMPTYVSTLDSLTAAPIVANSAITFSFDVDSTHFLDVDTLNCIYATTNTPATNIDSASSDFTKHTYANPFVFALTAKGQSAQKSTTTGAAATASTTGTKTGGAWSWKRAGAAAAVGLALFLTM